MSDGHGSRTHSRVVGVDLGNDESLTLLPVDKGVELPTETLVRDNKVMQRSFETDLLGRRETVDDALAPIEIGGMVEGVQPLCGCNVGIFISDGNRHGGDLLQLASNGVVSQRRDTQQGQPAVAGYSNDVDPCRRVAIERVSGIEQAVECQGLFAHIGL